MAREVRGVGLQLNPTLINVIGEDRVATMDFDFAELLVDMFAGPLDSGYVIDPSLVPLIDRLGARTPLVAHGNYGAEFGFGPLEETPSFKRHVQVTHAMESPWYADHMFFGDRASEYMWSSPLQFSHAEALRVADRAARLQDLLGKPLLHENAFYYARFPGSDISEVDFIGELIAKAQTWSLLDLHNIYSNGVNFEDYDSWRFIKSFPLDRVVEVHLAGGQHIEDWYHDLHNHPVPEPVWEMLRYVVEHAPNLKAVTLEFQGPAHTPKSRQVSPEWVDMIKTDLARAKNIWNEHKR